MSSPNIFVFVGDCLRAANVTPRTMPFLTDTADVRFEHCYSPGTWTAPAHASLYSVRAPVEHDVTRHGDTLAPEQARLPAAARDAGYETALFSENPVFSTATGFHHGVDFVDDSIDLKPLLSGFAGENHVDTIDASGALTLLREVAQRPKRIVNSLNVLYGLVENLTENDLTAYPHHGERVLAHLAEFVQSRDGQPLFCVANLLDTHNPHNVPPEDGAAPLNLSMNEDKRQALGAANDNRQYVLTDDGPPEAARREFETWTDVLSWRQEIYNAQIRYLDVLIDRWTDDVDNILAESLLVVTGDHGQLFGEEKMVGHHTSLHPHGVQVPLFVRFPSDWESTERTVSTPVSLVGVATALRGVAAGEITNTDEFVQAISNAPAGRTDDGRVIVCADGPTWRIAQLREQYADEYVDPLAVRRIGLVDDERMEVYSARWGTSTIEGVAYELLDGDRKRIGAISNPNLNAEHRRWLVTGSENSVNSEMNARLEALGYK